MWNLFLLICLSIPLFSNVQGYQFDQIEFQINTLLTLTYDLRDIVYQEKANSQSTAPNITSHATLDLTRGAFTTDVENRLTEMTKIIETMRDTRKVCPIQDKGVLPPQNITVFTETVGNWSTIRVSWDPPNPEPYNMQYRVIFTPIAPNGTLLSPVFFNICDKFHTVASITEVHPNTKLNITVSTISGPTYETPSDPIQIKTFDQIPPSPSYLRAFDITPNSVTLRWDKPPIWGSILAYHIHGKNMLGDQIKEIVKPPVEEYVLSNLPEGTPHVFVVTAESDNGEGQGSPKVDVTTLEFEPPAPINLKCVQFYHDMITLNWKTPTMYPGMGLTRGYNISVKDDMYNVLNYFTTDDITVTSTNITNLTAYSDFYFSATSYTRRRQGPTGIVINCKTKPTFPSPPRNLQKFNHTYGPPSVRITWEPSMYRNDKSVNYSVEWGVVNGAKRIELVTEGRMEFISDYLDYKADHIFTVTAVNSVGYSEPATIYHTTPDKEVIVPPNVTVHRSEHDKNVLHVKWKKPNRKIFGYRVLYRKFEWVYSGRWEIETIPNPLAQSTNISVADAGSSYIVVIRCILDPPGTPYNPGPYHPNPKHPNFYPHGPRYHGPPQGPPYNPPYNPPYGPPHGPSGPHDQPKNRPQDRPNNRPNGPPQGPPYGPPPQSPPQVNFDSNVPRNVGNNQQAQGPPQVNFNNNVPQNVGNNQAPPNLP